MKKLLIGFFSIIAFSCAAQSLTVYPALNSGLNLGSDRFKVSIIQNGAVKNSFVYETTAGSGNHREWSNEQNNSLHFTTFSFTGTVTIRVVKLNSSASSAVIRPNRLGIGTVPAHNQNDNSTVSFKLNQPAKLSVEFNDDPGLKDALLIFADTAENTADVPDTGNPNVYQVTDSSSLAAISTDKTVAYFGPGIHKIGYWNIPSTIQQVYIAGGSYVIGYLYRERATIKINGRGILSNKGFPYHYPSQQPIGEDFKTWYKMINILGGQGHIIEGITLVDGTSYNILVSGSNILIKNVNISGFRLNNDGISLNGTNNHVNGCLIRTNDDAITMSGSNITINNCTFWQLQGSVIQLGWTPQTINGINIYNCEVLHDKAKNSEGDVGFINAMNYTKAKKETVVSNVTVDNIYFDTPILRFLDIRGDRTFKLADYGADANPSTWKYENFHISNIHFSQSNKSTPLIYLHGYNDSSPLSNFTLQNVYMSGSKVSNNKLNDRTFIDKKNVDQVKLQ